MNENDLTKTIQVYPNPSDGMVTVNVEKTCSFHLIDANGKTIIKKELNKDKNLIDLSELKGFYVYEIWMDNQKFSGRIVMK